MYQIEYLPIARRDMVEIVKYISQMLCNPSAAEKLADEMIQAAERLIKYPYIHPVYRTIKPLMHDYRKLKVKNYVMFYYIDEVRKKVVVSRVIYSRRDFEKLL